MRELMTPKKIEQRERNEKICSEFKSLKKKYPTTSNALLFEKIAEGYSIEAPAIRAIVKARGLC